MDISIFRQYFSFDLNEVDLGQDIIEEINTIITNDFPTNHEDFLKLISLKFNKERVIHLILENSNEMSYNVADAILLTLDSFMRPKALIKLYGLLDRKDWAKLFQETWTMCDSCSLYHSEFNFILNQYSIQELRELCHTESDDAFYDSLPDEFEIYRGTFDDPRFDGISWTTSLEVAQRFKDSYENVAEGGAMAIRYKHNMDSDTYDLIMDIAKSGTSLKTMLVKKSDVFVNTSRGELEIIVRDTK